MDKQVAKADEVLRVVVIEIARIEYKDKEEWRFEGLAKCRVVTNYSGNRRNVDFIYIPCDYNFEESPSPLVVGQDCIISLEFLGNRPIAHPVSWDSVHEIRRGKVLDPESKAGESRIPMAKFEARIRELIESAKK